MAKRVRYVCRGCGAERRYFPGSRGALMRIDCTDCGAVKGMETEQAITQRALRVLRTRRDRERLRAGDWREFSAALGHRLRGYG